MEYLHAVSEIIKTCSLSHFSIKSPLFLFQLFQIIQKNLSENSLANKRQNVTNKVCSIGKYDNEIFCNSANSLYSPMVKTTFLCNKMCKCVRRHLPIKQDQKNQCRCFRPLDDNKQQNDLSKLHISLKTYFSIL